jgi:hypothetical protein
LTPIFLRPVVSLPWTRRQVAAGLAALFVGLFVFHSLLARWVWEKDANVELCVDGAEIQQLADQDDNTTWRILESLREKGVSSVAVYWDPHRPLWDVMDEWALRLPHEMSLTLRPEPVPFSDWVRGWPRNARPRRDGPAIQHVLFSGPAVLGYPDMGPVQEWLNETPYSLPVMEFGRQRGQGALQKIYPGRIVRGHSFTEEEMALASSLTVVTRFRRAVRERGVRFLYVRLLPGIPKEANLDFVGRLTGALRADGWRLAPTRPRYDRWDVPFIPLSTGLRTGLALAVSVTAPLAAFFWTLRRKSPSVAPLGLAGTALAAGLVVAALLATPSFALGFTVYRGVKASLLIPLAVALFALYRGDELRRILDEPVTVGRLMLGAVVLGAVAYFVLRSGHGTLADASGLELSVRGRLETALGIRPRFKEFLIGHPCLWLGFYLRWRLGHGDLYLPMGKGLLPQALRFLFHDARPFLLAGLIGPLSIINTFCHAHTPLWVSMVRTIHGVWLGALIGLSAVALLGWMENRWKSLP